MIFLLELGLKLPQVNLAFTVISEMLKWATLNREAISEEDFGSLDFNGIWRNCIEIFKLNFDESHSLDKSTFVSLKKSASGMFDQLTENFAQIHEKMVEDALNILIYCIKEKMTKVSFYPTK